RAHTRLIFAKGYIGAVAAEYVRLRHGQWAADLAGITENEFAGLDERPLAGQRIEAAAFDRGLIDTVLVAERIEVARLGAEVLDRENADAGEAFILLARDREGALMAFFRVAIRAHTDMGLSVAECRFPVLRIVDADVGELLRSCRHPDA